MSTTDRPEIVTEEMIKFLDLLRDIGAINSYGLAPYLQERFDMDKADARTVHQYWMASFEERHAD